jgi:hypothetical protein
MIDFEAITIRRADNTDIKRIWDLLHADCKGWSMEMITGNLEHLLVLCKQNKLLGVLYGALACSKAEIFWIVIHPFYPEKEIKQLFIQTLHGTRQLVEKERKRQKIYSMIPCRDE